MIDDLFKYYKDELTFKSIVFRHNGIWKNSMFYLLLLIFVVFVISCALTKIIALGICAIVFFIVSVLFGSIIIGITIKNKYPKQYISCFNWSVKGLDKVCVEKLGKYLNNLSLNDKKLDILQELIREKAKKSVFPSMIFLSTFIALIIPLGSVLISKLLNINTNQLEIIKVIFLCIMAISFLNIPFIIFRNDYITKFNKWNRLNELISEWRLLKE
jgi:hypothetical protein